MIFRSTLQWRNNEVKDEINHFQVFTMIQNSFGNVKEQVVFEFLNQYWKYVFSNIMKVF